MTLLGECDVCKAEAAVGIAAVPGVPMSLAYGHHCLANYAVPLWVADFTISQCVPFDDLDWRHLTDWFRQQTVPVDGAYKRVDELTMVVGPCSSCGGSGEDEEHGGPVEFKDGSRVEHACLMCYRGQVVTTEEALKERES
jgi:hypothetical protein